MLIILRPDASQSDRDRVVALIGSLGFSAQTIEGSQRHAVAVVGNDGRVDAARFSALPGWMRSSRSPGPGGWWPGSGGPSPPWWRCREVAASGGPRSW